MGITIGEAIAFFYHHESPVEHERYAEVCETLTQANKEQIDRLVKVCIAAGKTEAFYKIREICESREAEEWKIAKTSITNLHRNSSSTKPSAC